jgi:hypothetical protein
MWQHLFKQCRCLVATPNTPDPHVLVALRRLCALAQRAYASNREGAPHHVLISHADLQCWASLMAKANTAFALKEPNKPS